MKRFVSRLHGNPSELEYYANKKEYGLQEALKERREIMVMHNAEFERARNVERGELIEKSQDGRRMQII